ncbi:PP2C family protein-serine/threonine phosphatase [Vallicoccus soli]|uniref:Serine/threonine-protein phosphatase n=1 Tax=Vallicoccus soli TaxID=2339232 RepID=A0A3A3YZ24_9ACTN|nr:PP2C family protein-serine/threonine phosphatase [Vallicoccus soli]RJK96000.1 serine/threonine-protein phosphatase [Vallicoccus soli]
MTGPQAGRPGAPGELDLGGMPVEGALALFLGLLGRTHLSAPAEVAAAVAETVRSAGGDGAVAYLVDYEQRHLVPVPARPARGVSVLGWPGEGEPAADELGRGGDDEALVAARRAEALALEGTMAGRCWVASEILQAPEVPGRQRLWLPLLDGTERVGVLTLTVPSTGPLPHGALVVWERFAHLAAQVLVSKSAYGDTLERVRRLRRMGLAGELQWGLLPPLTFATRGLVVSAMLEPCYEDGGDSFDYAVNESSAHFAIIDAMGHGLAASGAAAFALAAYRRARRSGLDLAATCAAVDDDLAGVLGGERYATAVLAELDLASGELSWVSAGHPEPLLLRAGRLVKSLEAPPSTPLGLALGTGAVQVRREQLEPGDRVLLYTDGLPEARQPDGGFFGLERLVDFVERAGQDGYPAPETLRRLRHAVLQHQHGALQDDASALLVEWRRDTERALLPQTVDLGGGRT